MIVTREIGKKGQVVIPMDIRKMLGIREGDKIIFEIENNEVKIKPEQDPERFLEDFLNVPKLKKKMSAKDIKKMIESQYDEEYEDLFRR